MAFIVFSSYGSYDDWYRRVEGVYTEKYLAEKRLKEIEAWVVFCKSKEEPDYNNPLYLEWAEEKDIADDYNKTWIVEIQLNKSLNF